MFVVIFTYLKLYSFCFGLVSLFNGISTFVRYLMPKPFSKKNVAQSAGAVEYTDCTSTEW